MTVSTYDVIVVGVGGMGSATLFELARRGQRVLGLEQHQLGHDQGSSHGHTRIIRQAYYEHPAYVPLVQRAYQQWFELEQVVGRHLLTACDCLSIGEPESELLRGVRASADTHGLAVESLSCTDLRCRFPMFRFGDDYAGVLERSSGFLYVDDCVRAHCQAARNLGAVIQADEPVWSWKANGNGVEIETNKGRYTAKGLILTAGAWAAELLTQWVRCLTVMRQVAFWFGTSQPETFRRDRFPLYICDTPEGYFYGFPMLNANGPKVAQHYGAPELPGPTEVERSISATDEEQIRGFLREHLPGIDGPVRQASVCLYTLTPDRHFVIDVHPEHPHVVVAAGFSGHGFKFAPVIGEVLADLVEKGSTNWPIDLFRLARFDKKSDVKT
jgi:sarcosine oxidase